MPSGTFSIRATTPATPTSNTSVGPGSSSSGSRDATIAIVRAPERTSSISLIERGWPTASGVSVSGKATMSLSGSTGRAPGSSRSS